MSVESYIITVQFRRNNGSFGGKDYAYKVSSPLYRPNEKTQILIQNMVNEKGYAYKNDAQVTGIFRNYDDYDKYFKKCFCTCAEKDILFLESFRICEDFDSFFEYSSQSGKDGSPLVTYYEWADEKKPIIVGSNADKRTFDKKDLKEYTKSKAVLCSSDSWTASFLNCHINQGNSDLQISIPNNSISQMAVDGTSFNGMFQGLKDSANKVADNIFEEKESKMDFSKMMNVDFGKISTKELKPSIYGVAVLGSDNRYRAYDKANDKVMDVTGMTFDTDMLFKIPVAVSQVRIGDVIINAGNYVTVTNVHRDNTFTVVDPKASEQKIAIPAKNMFGFDFVTKVIYPLENMIQPNDTNPFGLNPMAMVLLAGDSNMDMTTILAMSMMGGNGIMDQNMLLPLMLMGNKSGNSDNLVLAMMMMNQMPRAAKNNKSDVIKALDSCPVPPVIDAPEPPTGVNPCEDDE